MVVEFFFNLEIVFIELMFRDQIELLKVKGKLIGYYIYQYYKIQDLKLFFLLCLLEYFILNLLLEFISKKFVCIYDFRFLKDCS